MILGQPRRENSAACALFFFFTRKDKLNMYSVRALPAFLSGLQEMKLRYQAQQSGGKKGGGVWKRGRETQIRTKLMSCGIDREKKIERWTRKWTPTPTYMCKEMLRKRQGGVKSNTGRQERRHEETWNNKRGGECKGKEETNDKKKEKKERGRREKKGEALLVRPQCKHPARIYPLPVSFVQQQGAFNSPSL